MMVQEPTRAPVRPGPSACQRLAAGRVPLWLIGVGLFVAVFGVKALMISSYGSDLPFWDEWAKQGQMIIAPYYTGALHLGDFFVPHSEHRIAPTLALNLALVAASGQWDTRVACLVNAGLHALIILAIVLWAARTLSQRWGLLLAWVSLALYALPLDWENTLTSFQSVFYFVVGTSLAAMAGLLDPRGPRGWAWWAGVGAAAVASVSLGSGFLCAAPVAAVAALRLGLGSRRRAGDAATLAVALALLAAGWIWRPHAPWDAPLQAHSAPQYLGYALQCLAWPRSDWPALAALIWLPWLALVVRTAIGLARKDLAGRRLPPAPLGLRTEMLLAAGVWSLLQVAAVAYGRAGQDAPPAYRYADIFAIGVLGNALSFSEFRSRFARALAAPWLVVILGAALLGSLTLWRGELPAVRDRARLFEANVRGYVATGDAHYLDGEIPFPDPVYLRHALDNPVLRAVLPPSVRAPLPVAPAGQPAGFGPGRHSPATAPLVGLPTWGSYGAAAPAAWRSVPIPPTGFPFWQIQLAGDVPSASARLRVETISGSYRSEPVAPKQRAGDAWRTGYVAVPRGEGALVLHASTDTPAAWLAFSGPVEVSAASEVARRVARHGGLLLGLGTGLLGLGTLLVVMGRKPAAP